MLARFCLTLLPILYMYFIWWQSSHFNPESIFQLANILPLFILYILGAAFEMAHLFEFGLLYLLLIILVLSYGSLTHNKEKICFVAALFFGLIDEIHQIFVPFRTFSIVDFIKDAIGIIFVWHTIHKNYFNIGKMLKRITTTLNQ
jgi:hypothetical protein